MTNTICKIRHNKKTRFPHHHHSESGPEYPCYNDLCKPIKVMDSGVVHGPVCVGVPWAHMSCDRIATYGGWCDECKRAIEEKGFMISPHASMAIFQSDRNLVDTGLIEYDREYHSEYEGLK